MNPTRLLVLCLALVGCDPDDTDSQDTDAATLSGLGLLAAEREGEVESVSFELSTPTIDPCDGCDFHAAVSDDDGRIGDHIAWDEDDRRLLFHGGGGWTPFWTEEAELLAGNTWASVFSEGELGITIETPEAAFVFCEEESGESLQSPPETSASDSGVVDCSTALIHKYVVPMKAGESLDLWVTAPPGNDPYVALGDGECIAGFFDDGLPCYEEDPSRLCTAATFTAPTDMDLDIMVDWYKCGQDGFDFTLSVGGDISALPEPVITRYVEEPYYDEQAVAQTESLQLRWSPDP